MLIELDDTVLPPSEDETPAEIRELLNRQWMAFIAADDGDPHYIPFR